MNPLRRLLPNVSESLRLRLYQRRCRRKRTISQVGQDFWVFGEAFNEMIGGYFLDVGAADGMSLSNTFLLEKRYRWHGICIEASPLLFKRLRRVRSVTCVNACVDYHEHEVDFALRGMMGGILAGDTDNRPKEYGAGSCDVIRMKTKTLASILRTANAPKLIDYLSIDAEGAEDRILCSFPFDKYRFNCMTIERPGPGLEEVLHKNGYIQAKIIPNLDTFYIHESFLSIYAHNAFKFWEHMGI